jgi:hypothetical protein
VSLKYPGKQSVKHSLETGSPHRFLLLGQGEIQFQFVAVYLKRKVGVKQERHYVLKGPEQVSQVEAQGSQLFVVAFAKNFVGQFKTHVVPK